MSGLILFDANLPKTDLKFLQISPRLLASLALSGSTQAVRNRIFGKCRADGLDRDQLGVQRSEFVSGE